MAWGEQAAEQHEKDQPSWPMPDPKPEHYVIANGIRYDVPETPAERTLDDAERRGD